MHKIKKNHFKSTGWWVLANIYIFGVNIITIKICNIAYILRFLHDALQLIYRHSKSKIISHLLLITILPFLELYMKEIIRYILLCLTIFFQHVLRFIYVIPCIHNSFITPSCICDNLFNHSLGFGHLIVFSFGLL